MREIVTLRCDEEECKRREYTTTKNKKTHTDRLKLRKYCKWCGRHTHHIEIK